MREHHKEILTEPAEPVGATLPVDTREIAYNEGIDDIEIQINPTIPSTAPHLPSSSPFPPNMSEVHHGRTGTLISALATCGSPCNDYDPMWLVHTHPNTFPHGKGGRPAGMSEADYFECIARRYPPEQFAQNLSLLANMYDIKQRHAVLTQSGVEVRMRPQLIRQLDTLTEQDVNKILMAFTSRASGSALQKSIEGISPPGRMLLRSLKHTARRVEGTPQSFLSLRSKVLCATSVFGAYTLMLNLCPYELNSPWTFTLAGRAYRFDAMGRPEGRPPHIECMNIIAANPLSCAEFLHAYFAAFCDVILGWPMHSKRQLRSNCLFGVISVAYMKYESSGRGGKHAHGQICQPLFQQTRLAELFAQGNAVQKQLFDLMDHLTSGLMPTPMRHIHHASEPMWDPRIDLAADDFPIRREVLTERIPLNSDEKTLRAWLTEATIATNMHEHRPTCKKGGRAGDHTDCRMGYDRPLVPHTQCLRPGSTLVLQKRHHGNLVAHSMCITAAEPANHSFSFSHECSRYLRDLLLWKDRVACGDTTAEEPRVVDAAIASALQSEYSSKYSTKSDNTPENIRTLQVAKVLAEKNEKTARTILTKLLNRITGSVSYPLVMLSSYLLGHGDFWFPIGTAAHNYWSFQQDLLSQQKGIMYEDGEVNVTLNYVLKGGKTYTSATTPVTDYKSRSPYLTQWSPVEVTMAFDLKPAKTRASRTFALIEPHPKALIHGHNPRKDIVLPQSFSSNPARPDDAASQEDKETYAAFALGNFYPYDRAHNDLNGTTLWDKYKYWVDTMPRGKADALAKTMLHNLDQSAQVRDLMKAESAAVIRRFQLRKSTHQHDRRVDEVSPTRTGQLGMVVCFTCASEHCCLYDA